MSRKHLLLLLQNICHFLLECKIFFFIFILHCSFHCTHIVFYFFLSFFLLLCFLSHYLVLNINLLCNLVFLVVFFYPFSIFGCVYCFFYWSWSYSFLVFIFLLYLLSFRLFSSRLFFFRLLFFWLLLFNICARIRIFWESRRNLILRSYYCFLIIITRPTIIRNRLNWFWSTIVLFFFFNIFCWVYFLDLLSRHLVFSGIIFAILFNHFVIHLVQLRVVFESVSIPQGV